MKLKHCSGYAIFSTTVVFNLLSMSALAQDAQDNRTPPPGQPAAAPAVDDNARGQDQEPVPAVRPSTQSDQNKPESAYNVVRTPDGAFQVQPGTPYVQDRLFSRHLVDRTRQILTLRRLLALRFSAEDIAVALPLLRRLNDIKAAPPLDPERALESEYEALLLARPGDPMPPSSAYKITDAARYYRDEQAKIWSEMARKLGRAKADGLYNLLGQTDQTIAPVTGNRAAKPTPYPVPNSRGYSVNPSLRATPPVDARPGAPVGIVPPAADPADARPGAPVGIVPPAADPRGALPRTTPDSRAAYSPEYSLMVYSPTTVRISLSELIDLMQTKLNAMIRTSNGVPTGR